jgi:hypothetical protein
LSRSTPLSTQFANGWRDEKRDDEQATHYVNKNCFNASYREKG